MTISNMPGNSFNLDVIVNYEKYIVNPVELTAYVLYYKKDLIEVYQLIANNKLKQIVKTNLKKICGVSICNKCKDILPVSQFHSNHYASFGLSSICKECKKKYYLKNRQKIIEKKRKYRRINAELISEREALRTMTKHRQTYKKRYREINKDYNKWMRKTYKGNKKKYIKYIMEVAKTKDE